MITKRCRNCKKRAAFVVHPIVATLGRAPRLTATGPGTPLCEACVLSLDSRLVKDGSDSVATAVAQTAARLKRKYSAVGMQQVLNDAD